MANCIESIFQDSIRPSNVETYRCSHKLSIGRNDGNSFDPENPYQDIKLHYLILTLIHVLIKAHYIDLTI